MESHIFVDLCQQERIDAFIYSCKVGKVTLSKALIGKHLVKKLGRKMN
jgi:hypothetical protein